MKYHFKEIKELVMERLDLSRTVEDEEVYQVIDACILEYGGGHYVSLKEKIKLRRDLFYAIRKLDVLSELLDQEDITEIMINDYDRIFIEKEGKVTQYPGQFSDAGKLLDVIQQIVAKCNRIVNEASPIVDARLEDGARVNVVLPPVALNGPTMTIRKFPQNAMTMDQLISLGSLEKEVADKLRLLVASGYNLFISGGTGSGKTTFLNALTNYIPREERIITIEDAAELKIENIENLVRLEVRNANVAGENSVGIGDLIKASLRMRPNRIIVGEVRDGAALEMLQAMNTGHDGSISTGHANSARDMLNRLETMVLMGADMPVSAIRKQIAAALDVVIHLGRLRDGTRRVLEIVEVLGLQQDEIQLKPLYQFKETGQEEESGRVIGHLQAVDTLVHVEKLKRKGMYEEYEGKAYARGEL